MTKIGILFGMENTFPFAVVERINSRNVSGVTAEPIKIGAVKMAESSGYRVLIDRISDSIPFYWAYLKNAALGGAIVINNPFWRGTDDKFFNYALASRLGVAVPRTVILPHFECPRETTDQSMRNLQYPLDWDNVFAYIGFPAYLKPLIGRGGKHVVRVRDRQEFFAAYHQTGDLCMMLQESIEFKEYFRCYVVGQEKVHVMSYDPRQPPASHYVEHPPLVDPALYSRVVDDALKLCRALGYDLNTVEFAVRNDTPYAIDFLNPAPNASLDSVGPEHFEWIVDAVADLAIRKALGNELPTRDLRWSAFLYSEHLARGPRSFGLNQTGDAAAH